LAFNVYCLWNVCISDGKTKTGLGLGLSVFSDITMGAFGCNLICTKNLVLPSIAKLGGTRYWILAFGLSSCSFPKLCGSGAGF
jgi:hypothetical protein